MIRIGIACLLGLQLGLAAGQSQIAPPAEKLRIQILEGQAAIHNIHQRAESEIQVQVNDQADHPVPGATVTFSLPEDGPSGRFAKDSTTASAQTDAHGRATVKGFRPNDIAGKMTIEVSASHQSETTHATITQFNVAVEKPHKSSTGKIVAILGVVGAGAAGGAYAAIHKSSSPTPAAAPAPVPTISIVPGASVAGPPR